MDRILDFIDTKKLEETNKSCEAYKLLSISWPHCGYATTTCKKSLANIVGTSKGSLGFSTFANIALFGAFQKAGLSVFHHIGNMFELLPTLLALDMHPLSAANSRQVAFSAEIS